MKTPREKYQHDLQYRELVNTLESFIHHAQFTPSELREAAILAAINYEMRKPRPIIVLEVASALDILDKNFVNKEGEY